MKTTLSILSSALLLASCHSMKTVGTEGTPVDLGLSVLWADHNLGATAESETGAYWAWKDSTQRKMTDKARRMWKHGWRMPNTQQLQELMDACRWEWQKDPVTGYRVTGRNGNSIFLPAGDNQPTADGYWSAEPDSLHNPHVTYMYFNPRYPDLSYTEATEERMIRPVKRVKRKEQLPPAVQPVQKAEPEATTPAAPASASPTDSLLELTANTVVALNKESTDTLDFVCCTADSLKDGLFLLKPSQGTLCIKAKGVSAFSIWVIGEHKGEVEITYRKDGQDDIVAEQIERAGMYEIPAIVCSKEETQVITLRVTKGWATPVYIHFLHTVEKASFATE